MTTNNRTPKFTERIAIRLKPAHLAKLERIAEREGNDVPSVVRRIISEYGEVPS